LVPPIITFSFLIDFGCTQNLVMPTSSLLLPRSTKSSVKDGTKQTIRWGGLKIDLLLKNKVVISF
jgi:hypothetical protein